MKQNQSLQRGSALVSAMVSAVVVSVGILGLAKLGSSTNYRVNHAKQQAEATLYAENLLEQFRTYESVETAQDKVAYADIASNYDAVSGLNAAYTRTWSVSEDTTNGVKTVSVTVGWTDAKRQSNSVTLSSNIAQADPSNAGRTMLTPSASSMTPTFGVQDTGEDDTNSNGNGNGKGKKK